jgi:hypothetical protein
MTRRARLHWAYIRLALGILSTGCMLGALLTSNRTIQNACILGMFFVIALLISRLIDVEQQLDQLCARK